MKQSFNKNKNVLRQIRHVRVRKALAGTAAQPRLSVFRSLRGMVAQLIDDSAGRTLCYADTKELPVIVKKDHGETKYNGSKAAASYLLGKLLAEKAKVKGIGKVKFDRGGYKYHGRVKALADGAREGGLIF
jgi:large subunit ribosomal protein L18